MVIKLCICLVLLITDINGIFVSVGNYSRHLKYGINVPGCGLQYVPEVYELSFNRKCFSKQFPNKTIKMIGEMSAYKEILAKSRIFNGRDSLFGEVPWNVFMRINENGMCGGSLITMEWVLTAAHCLVGLNSGYAYSGSNRLSENKMISMDANKAFPHPYFVNPGLANMSESSGLVEMIHDIGLIKLTRKFTRKVHKGRHYLINSICLPRRNQVNGKNEYATLAGFGLINNRHDTPEVLQIEDNILLDPYTSCNYRGIICASRAFNQTKSCAGDSGGGLFQTDPKDLNRAIIAGIINGGTNSDCTNPASEEFFTVPSKYIDWILKTIKSN